MERILHQQIVDYKQTNKIPEGTEHPSNWKYVANKYELLGDETLTRQGKYCLCKDELPEIWRQFHWGRHSGICKTWALINERFYFRGGKEWVDEKIKECIVCNQNCGRGWEAIMPPLKPIEVTPQLFWRVHFDLAGPFPVSNEGNKHIALGVCAFSKFIEACGNNLYIKTLSFSNPRPRFDQFSTLSAAV